MTDRPHVLPAGAVIAYDSGLTAPMAHRPTKLLEGGAVIEIEQEATHA
ncbi:hypothetical protein [Alicycliphilus denitrificans]|nr:hypothetical protein [Alicycliphilus denitrificans]